ncbi:MAG: hypothetical protein Q9211_001101 [Gyalolechia sp. 1 TL-2023]
MPTQILSPEALTRLNESGCTPVVNQGWYSLPARYIPYISSSGTDTTMKLPTILESIETLVFIGFTQAAAEQILQRYQQDESSDGVTPALLDFVKSHVRSFPDAVFEEDDWDAAMATMGIKQSVRSGIMSPEFWVLMLSETARFWVIDTIETKYKFLESVDQSIIARSHGWV